MITKKRLKELNSITREEALHIDDDVVKMIYAEYIRRYRLIHPQKRYLSKKEKARKQRKEGKAWNS